MIFQNFKNLKNKESLGESKYKKLTTNHEDLSENQEKRYFYTLSQVIVEASNYGLVKENFDSVSLTEAGIDCLMLAEKGKIYFYERMLELMESKHYGFYDLVNLCYNKNKLKNGILIFPVYSPLKLGFEKDDMKTNGDWEKFSVKLMRKIESDIEKFLGRKVNLVTENNNLLKKLDEDQILPSNNKDSPFNHKNYNSIINRFRKFWLNYFLKNIYNYGHSFETFNIWVERAKQLGIIHSTEFYPDFDGRIVFPTSIVVAKNNNSDLVKVFTYENGESLYIHKPDWNGSQNAFFTALVDSYFDLRKNRRTHYVRLSDLREKVCFKMRIPSYVFNDFLKEAYYLNLKGETAIQISLEADRLPYETNAMYLKREPVLVNGQYKNIISIDYKNKT